MAIRKIPKVSISCLVGFFFPFQFCDIENLAKFSKYLANLVEFSLKNTKKFPFFLVACVSFGDSK
jgi:hypothetical protein